VHLRGVPVKRVERGEKDLPGEEEDPPPVGDPVVGDLTVRDPTIGDQTIGDPFGSAKTRTRWLR
jgi:hypothetical protein